MPSHITITTTVIITTTTRKTGGCAGLGVFIGSSTPIHNPACACYF
jgi:hypothetical protein